MLGIIVVALISLALLVWLIDRSFSAPHYRGPVTDHFNGNKFQNTEPPERSGFLDFLRWQFNRQQGAWNKWTNSEPGTPPPRRVNGAELRVTFINHATVLIQTSGLNILTDPIWSERASPVTWAGPRRHRSPGLKFEDLPLIDLVLISHNHYDHLDVASLANLRTQHQPRFLTGLGNGALLQARGIANVTQLDWWETAGISNDVQVTCVPAKHFSGRGLSDGDCTLWCGYVIQAPAGNIYFAGDTGMGNHFAAIKKRFKEFRLVLLPIGAYLPQWFMHPVHISPSQAVDVHRMLKPSVSMAIHFGTFALGDDGELDPVAKLRESRPDNSFWILEHGEGRQVPYFATDDADRSG